HPNHHEAVRGDPQLGVSLHVVYEYVSAYLDVVAQSEEQFQHEEQVTVMSGLVTSVGQWHTVRFRIEDFGLYGCVRGQRCVLCYHNRPPSPEYYHTTENGRRY
ncbi:MAG: hypothetical protein OXI24_20150, partial [Candidatus Poribacteria bacterium]|nr:hypothetical protein [Candidatus Poribacteria bacterium]